MQSASHFLQEKTFEIIQCDLVNFLEDMIYNVKESSYGEANGTGKRIITVKTKYKWKSKNKLKQQTFITYICASTKERSICGK